MAKKAAQPRATGRITSGIQEGVSIARTIDFIQRQLGSWRDHPDRIAEEAEDQLNEQLSIFLAVRAREEFPMVQFQREIRQTERRRVDIAALPTESTIIEARPYTIYQAFLVIEGKRLPAPSPNREREYVTGADETTGGIQRFKLGLHGAEVSVAILIGYIQDETAGYWRGRINGWIVSLVAGNVQDGASWSDDENLPHLTKDGLTKVSRCESVHGRVGNGIVSPSIRLVHLWVEMNNEIRV